MQRKSRWMAICVAAGLCAGVAGATTIDTGTDWQNWEIVAGSRAEVDTLPTSSPWTTSEGFVFSTPDNNVINMPVSLGTTKSGLTTNDGEIDIATPAGGETAMLLDVGLWNGSWVIATGTVDVEIDGQTFSSVPYGSFWFSSSAPISSVAVLSSTAGDQPFVHALSYAISSLPPDVGTGTTNPSPIPEPAPILLVSAGGLILFGTRRRWFRPRA